MKLTLLAALLGAFALSGVSCRSLERTNPDYRSTSWRNAPASNYPNGRLERYDAPDGWHVHRSSGSTVVGYNL